MGESLLILRTRTLDNLSKRVEYLTSNSDSLEEVRFTGWINQSFTRIMPIKVHNGFLKPQQVIYSADDDVDGSCITCLST